MNIVVSKQVSKDGLFSACSKFIPGSILWDSSLNSIYDIYDIHKPRVLIAHTSEILKKHEEVIKDNKDTKLVIFGDSYEVQPDLLCTRKKIEDKANIFAYRACVNPIDCVGTPSKLFDCDVSYINTKQPTEEDIKILSIPSTMDIKYRTYNHKIPIESNIGYLLENDKYNVMASSKILIDLDGSNVLNGALNKCYVLSLYQNYFFPYTSMANIKADIEKLLSENNWSLVDTAYRKLMDGNTCMHRIKMLLQYLDEKELANYVDGV